MTLHKISETTGEVTYETEATENDVRDKIQALITKGTVEKNPFYYMRNPMVMVKKVNYFLFRVKPEYIYVRRSFMAPPYYLYFKKGAGSKSTMLFKANYLRLWLPFSLVFFALAIFQCYTQFQEAGFGKDTLLIIAMYFILTVIVSGIAYSQDWVNSYFFKKSVAQLVNDIHA
jgi:hypothetical protein